jgi:hypothetical protein
MLRPGHFVGLEIRGESVPAPRWELVWLALDPYEPKTAEQLAVLRQSRECKKAEREEQKHREENPFFTVWAE